MAGHVFITHSDLTRLNCDAWLLPCDETFYINPAWTISEDILEQIHRLQEGETSLPPSWGSTGVRVLSLRGSTEGMEPYLVNVGGDNSTKIDWYMDGVRQFLKFVASQDHIGNNSTGRMKPLVGMPLVGVGLGGAEDVKGGVVRALIQILHQAVESQDIDIALVVRDEPAFMAVQNARRRYLENPGRGTPNIPWPELDRWQVIEAERLAAHAAVGRLVLFVGAGVSQGAALPSWRELLEGLAEDAGMSSQERKALEKLHSLDRALIIQHRLEARGTTIGQAVSDRIDSGRFSLAHSLLASLPVGEVVTTNYDCLFEEASSAANRTVAVLPYEAAIGRSRWLLKLHGSVTHPDDIVLTREHYLRYADRRAALSAIVQALLITRHMLFVGFSLTDDNFHRIVDDVRKVVRSTTERGTVSPFGSALLVRSDDLLEELWRDDLHLVRMEGNRFIDVSDQARQLDIFLDLLVSESVHGNSPLLDPAYDGILSDEEREIRGLLEQLEAGASEAARQSTAWISIRELLTKMGRKDRKS
jgi:hypothetical protein